VPMATTMKNSSSVRCNEGGNDFYATYRGALTEATRERAFMVSKAGFVCGGG
jgi:hypothetical protein